MKTLSNEALAALQDYNEPSNESLGYERNIAETQYKQDIKDFIGWGNEECFEHPYSSRAKGEAYNRKRHRCPECWGALEQLVEK